MTNPVLDEKKNGSYFVVFFFMKIIHLFFFLYSKMCVIAYTVKRLTNLTPVALYATLYVYMTVLASIRLFGFILDSMRLFIARLSLHQTQQSFYIPFN